MAVNNKIGKFVASFFELFNREISTFGDDRIYKNDTDNLYPNRVESIERNSVTAKAASNKLKSFIVGKGFKNKDFNEMIVNPKTGMKGYEFLNKIAKTIATHRGCFVQVNYDIENEINLLEVLPYKKSRVSKEDSFGYSGCIYFKDWAEESKFSKSNNSCRWFYPFNKNPKAISDQRVKDLVDRKADLTPENMVTQYRGQVYFLNLDFDEVYPFATCDSVMNDCDSEYRMSLYINTMLRGGFLGKKIMIANGIAEEDAEDMENTIKDWMGAENTSTVLTYIPTTVVDDPTKIFTSVDITTGYDSKQFEQDKASIANNIRKAYYSIPRMLIDPEDNFFGSSGAAMQEAVKYYNSETLHIREAIAYMMDKFFNGDFTIAELGVEDLPESNTSGSANVDDKTKEAQAALRGSVGGVQGILAIQQSYSQQLTDLESAITILVEIYGFTREVALSLLGSPEIVTEDEAVQ